MLENEVEFGLPNKYTGGFFNYRVYSWFAMLFSFGFYHLHYNGDVKFFFFFFEKMVM
jgi:hypothetical protein